MYKYAIIQEIPYKRAETLRKNQTNLPTRLKEIVLGNDKELLKNFIKHNKLQDVKIIER